MPAALPPHDVRRDKRPSTAGNSSSSKRAPAEPQVISSLIASLDDSNSSFTHASYAYVSTLDSYDDDGTFYSSPSLRRPLKHSQSFGMDYGAYRQPIQQDDYDSDGADFPVVRTSRRPQGRSTHTAPSSPGLHGLREILRSASKTSLSLNRPEVLSRSNSRLSVDSWNRKNSSSSPTKLSLDTPSSSERLGGRLSLRQTSRETLKPNKDLQHSADQALLSPNLGLEARDLGRKNTKGRLYLEDVLEDMATPSPIISLTRLPAATAHPSSSRDSSVKASAERLPASTSRSTLPTSSSSPMTTVIPPRSSSLNKLTSPTKPKAKKLSKGKRALAALREVREVKEERGSRRKSKADALKDMSVPDSAASTLADLQMRPANRAAARVPDLRKAHRMLGLDELSKNSSTVQPQDTTTASPFDSNLHSKPSVVRHSPNVSASLSSFPPDSPTIGNAFSTSSDYYRPFHTQIANVAEEQPYDSSSVGRRAVARKSTHSHILNGLDIEGLDMSPPSTAHSNSTIQSRPRSSRRVSYDARFRRKSMSDARENRLLEDDILHERNSNVSMAVNAFLNNPRLNQKIAHPQTGRIISFSEVGDPNGHAVIVCVGMGLTRFVSVFYDDLASSLGLRLITPERPGVGASQAYRDRDHIGPLAWPDDVVTITHHLGISEFSLIAHSAGAIYALATALILPQSVRGKVQLLAPWIPPSQFENVSQKDRSPDNVPVAALTRGQRFLRVLPVPFLKAANGNLFSPASLKPANANKGNGSPTSGSESPRGVPYRRNSRRRPNGSRRESMILMDQVIPERPRDTMFPLPELCEDEKGDKTVRKPSEISLNLSATASPMDPGLMFAAEALSAAEHAAKEHQAAYSALLTERTWMLATRDANPATDLIVCLERHRDIGFRYVDVHKKVVITHGSEDKRVPVENIRWIGDQMNRHNILHWSLQDKDVEANDGGCDIRVLPGEGHGLMAHPGVMSDILSDISSEWSPTRWLML
ncbi:alpha/beta-hydrolase [Aureobasidium subglaciale]|nr:alpha/beta-hydrolase [Aureobasidium subglaciale]KAI5228540.1 alpha/beta-hydrolase [Aureobasidium subglaciale]KAI5231928.1 alpha/beta-hydrolase [Aureobasidium subglaciale]KAI5265860.1 alpha/beta-hydrolase [Aureobasidium subglaciale]